MSHPCKTCGAPIKWVKIGERWHCHNPDGTDHWDLCSKRKWDQVVATGRKFAHGNNKGYADSIHGTKYYMKEGGKTENRNKKLPRCNCHLPPLNIPPWDDCEHTRAQ